MSKIYVLNGPNLNMLGSREPEVYGTMNLTDIENQLRKASPEVDFVFGQTGSEDQLISWLHDAFQEKADVILNPAAFTHYSYALRDACAMLKGHSRLIEVHISNPHARRSSATPALFQALQPASSQALASIVIFWPCSS